MLSVALYLYDLSQAEHFPPTHPIHHQEHQGHQGLSELRFLYINDRFDNTHIN